MKSTLTLKNIGNIDNVSLVIKPLTVIAGENSSGKTFITKGLYTLLDSVYKNHFLERLSFHFRKLEFTFRAFQEELKKPSKKDLDFQDYFNLFLEEVKFFLIEIQNCQFKEQELISHQYLKKFLKFEYKTNDYFEERLKVKKFIKYKVLIEEVREVKSHFFNTLNKRPESIIEGISSSLEEGFKKNFQLTNLQHLLNKKQSSSLKLSLDNLGDMEISKNQSIDFNFKEDGINQIQNIENIIFFDSPVYTKIRKALEKNRNNFSPFMRKEDKYLQGYPQYLDKLYHFIDKEYIDIPDFNLISQEIQSMINGKLEVSQSGDINYKDNRNNIIPLSLTAMGISNIGLIDLLIRNNIINQGSFLIMDEPEVHLHPKWQVFLAQMLYKIAKSGATIILATHSLDFLKAFENILKQEEEEAEEIISINQMPYKDENTALSELEKVGLVLDDLSKPFYDLYMQDI